MLPALPLTCPVHVQTAVSDGVSAARLGIVIETLSLVLRAARRELEATHPAVGISLLALTHHQLRPGTVPGKPTKVLFKPQAGVEAGLGIRWSHLQSNRGSDPTEQ